MMPRVERALFEGVTALEELGLRYAVVGGLAVGVWAVPRATRDVDLYAELPDVSRDKLRQALVGRGFDVPAMAEELQQFGVFRSKLLREQVFVDIFDAVGPLGEAILQRRRKVSTGGRELWFASAEDIAILKAFSDRPRDQDDLVALLSVPESGLDASYLDRWANLLDESIGGTDVSERLSEAREKAQRNRGA
jgi:predicted nucleotidyltransferase